MLDGARSVLEGDSEKIGSAVGDGVVGAVDDEAGNGDASGVGDEQSDSEGRAVVEAGGVGLEGRGHEDGAAFCGEGEGFVDRDLFDVDAGADADGVTRGGGVDGGLDGSVCGGGTGDHVDVDEKGLGGGSAGEKRDRDETHESGEKRSAEFHNDLPNSRYTARASAKARSPTDENNLLQREAPGSGSGPFVRESNGVRPYRGRIPRPISLQFIF